LILILFSAACFGVFLQAQSFSCN